MFFDNFCSFLCHSISCIHALFCHILWKLQYAAPGRPHGCTFVLMHVLSFMHALHSTCSVCIRTCAYGDHVLSTCMHGLPDRSIDVHAWHCILNSIVLIRAEYDVLRVYRTMHMHAQHTSCMRII